MILLFVPRLSWLYFFVGISTICHVPICVLSCGQDLLLGVFVVIVEVTSVLGLRMDIVPEIICFLYFWSTR
jgi:Trk-type K+ transport system membrane component